MRESEKVAIAAHLHVLLRRKTGRVTDTEWMAQDATYAAEIVRFARAQADTPDKADLAAWADKLEAAVASAASTTTTRTAPAAQHNTSVQPPDKPPASSRYVWGIR